MECPRWRLTEPHYINVPTLPDGTRMEWEHRETARETGRTVRKLFPVPMLLNPQDPLDFNHPGEIIVTHDVEGAHMIRGDYIFTDKPTPGMEPLNEAAEALSAAERHRWSHPIDSLPANGGMNDKETEFMNKMMEAFSKVLDAGKVPTSVVPREKYDELLERVAALEAKATPADTSGIRRP